MDSPGSQAPIAPSTIPAIPLPVHIHPARQARRDTLSDDVLVGSHPQRTIGCHISIRFPPSTRASTPQVDAPSVKELIRLKSLGFIALTGYRLFNLFMMLAFGTVKLGLALHGYSVAPTALDWVGGVFFAMM